MQIDRFVEYRTYSEAAAKVLGLGSYVEVEKQAAYNLAVDTLRQRSAGRAFLAMARTRTEWDGGTKDAFFNALRAIASDAEGQKEGWTPPDFPRTIQSFNSWLTSVDGAIRQLGHVMTTGKRKAKGVPFKVEFNRAELIHEMVDQADADLGLKPGQVISDAGIEDGP